MPDIMCTAATDRDGASARARRLFDEGRHEFRSGHYFEAHDIWEELWRELRGGDREYLQALIHLAVGAYHNEGGNRLGAASQWRKAITKLDRYPDGHWGVETTAWRIWISDYLDEKSTNPHPRELPFDPSRFPSDVTLAPG